MTNSAQIAQHFRQVFFGGNWTFVNLKETLSGVNYEQATTKAHSFNTIAVLVFHINYYIEAITKVLEGGTLDAHDKYSFSLQPLQSEQDWNALTDKLFTNATHFAALTEALPDSKLFEPFEDGKYGNYYRNLHGIIEHTHYHLGQISLIKKLVCS